MRASISSLRLPYSLLATHQTLRIAPYACLPSRSIRHELPNRMRRPLSRPPSRLYNSPAFVHEEPTIYALSTAPGKAAIAVIRISGPACRQIFQGLCPATPLPKPRHATLRKLYAPKSPPSPATLLDSGALILYFPSPHTVTGEDVLELHVHGGPAIVRAVLAAIPQCCSPLDPPFSPQASTHIRYAEPGEFTRRAFANGRMTLPQIESLGETLSATTEQQRKLSVRGTTSTLADRYETWRTLLLQARGELEALIDFSEDQHFDESPAVLCANVARQVEGLKSLIEMHISNAVRGELLRSGISVALLGAPNAGKSSLLNRIVGREAAIVSQEAGTTRDVVEVGVDLGGWLVKFGDMAGLRRAGLVKGDIVGAVETEGIKRAKQRALESDVLIVVQDATTNLEDEVIDTVNRCVHVGVEVVVAINKVDCLSPKSSALADWKATIQSILSIPPDRIHFISCQERSASSPRAFSSAQDPGNIQSFLQGLMTTFAQMTEALVPDSSSTLPPDNSIWQESLGATERQRILLSECVSHLEAFLTAVHATSLASPLKSPHPDGHFTLDYNHKNNGTDPSEADGAAEEEVDIVVAAESLRLAAETLSRITGRGEGGDVEEVLGVVFEKFCVGK